MKQDKMNSGNGANDNDTLLKYYEVAHNEIIWRLRIRNGVLMTYLATVAAITGAWLYKLNIPLLCSEFEIENLFNTPINLILLTIPPIAMGFAMIFYHHTAMISALISYTKDELSLKLPCLMFEKSEAWDFYIDKAFIYSVWSYAVIIALPCLLSICFNSLLVATVKHIFFHLAGFLTVFCFCLAEYLIYATYKDRKERVTAVRLKQ
ncbi:MAG: hypothetical protein GY795_48310 [Desulfobacterales bacterium]|nr:hypothetical protein [Desulfobacterales bacterium]